MAENCGGFAHGVVLPDATKLFHRRNIDLLTPVPGEINRKFDTSKMQRPAAAWLP
jgi:hypothetical protein